MYSGILFLRAQTALHPGSGTSVGAVDLPVQRERYTGWPTVQGSAIKGILRDTHRGSLVKAKRDAGNASYTAEDANKDPELVDVFGPAEGDLHAGALAVTDARILAFPVRSARGTFVWVTSAPVLARARRDLEMAGLTPSFQVPASPSHDDQADATTGAADIWVAGNPRQLVLEDLLLKEVTAGRAELDKFAGWLATAGCGYGAQPTDVIDPRKRLALVSANAFNYLVKYATEIATRIKLDYKTKTVDGTALFTQELLPAETIFYSVLLAETPRSDPAKRQLKTAPEVIQKVAGAVSEAKVLQVGGDETTGKGWCCASVWPAPQGTGGNG